MLVGFIGENYSSTVACVACRTIGVVHAGDAHSPHHGFDLIAKAGEESQRIGRTVGDARDQLHVAPAPGVARLLRRTFPIV
jgi:hypothetical protein